MNNYYKSNERRFLRINTSDRDGVLSNAEMNRLKNIEALSEWFKRQITYTTFLYQNELYYTLRQGEVYEVDFGRNVGSEINERHYAVILHDSNDSSQNVLVCPLTTKSSEGGENALINIGRLPGLVTINDSFAKISQVRSVDKVRIYIRPVMNKDYNDQDFTRKVGPVSVLTDAQFRKITNAISEVFDNKRRI
jgi:mRNA-degrading endonuclease toxin of MazEF toxin-antitoxin module